MSIMSKICDIYMNTIKKIFVKILSDKISDEILKYFHKDSVTIVPLGTHDTVPLHIPSCCPHLSCIISARHVDTMTKPAQQAQRAWTADTSLENKTGG